MTTWPSQVIWVLLLIEDTELSLCMFNKLEYFLRQFYSGCGKSILLLHQNSWLSVQTYFKCESDWICPFVWNNSQSVWLLKQLFFKSSPKLIVNPFIHLCQPVWKLSQTIQMFNYFHKPFSCLGNPCDNFHMPFCRLHDPFIR